MFRIGKVIFVLFQGVNEANSLSYLTSLQRKKRAKEQAKMDSLFLYNSSLNHIQNRSFMA